MDIPWRNRAISDNNEEPKCARCGGRLEDGYAMAGRGLWWDREPHRLLPSGTTIIPQESLKVPAQRCFNCNLVIIQIQ